MKDDDIGAYVRRVNEDTRRYAEQLLAENRNLRERSGSLHAERDRLQEELARSQSECLGFRSSLVELRQDHARLEADLAAARSTLASHERERPMLDSERLRIDVDNRRFTEQFAALEQQNNNLANLYVASYRLHETLERATVLAVLQEILANLVGTEEVAIFELPAGARRLRLLAANGVDAERYASLDLDDGLIGRSVTSGEIYVKAAAADPASDGLTACVPLRLSGRVTGAIVIFRLLPQKTEVCDLDRELFALLATHAATALYCSCAAGGRDQSPAPAARDEAPSPA
jgi:hypothetical protein